MSLALEGLSNMAVEDCQVKEFLVSHKLHEILTRSNTNILNISLIREDNTHTGQETSVALECGYEGHH
jgi:hypothetical protein